MNRKIKNNNSGIADTLNINDEFTIAIDLVSTIIDDEVKYHFRSPLRIIRVIRAKFLSIFKIFFTIVFLLMKRILINPVTRNVVTLITSMVMTTICIVLLCLLIYWFIFDILHGIDFIYHTYADYEYRNKKLLVDIHDKLHNES